MTVNTEIDMWENYYKSNKDCRDREIAVAFYARVSTEHEAQVNALENQQSWCMDLLRGHPNWKMMELYTDRGITGTLAKRRNGFLQAVEDGKQKKYKLLVVRDGQQVCEELRGIFKICAPVKTLRGGNLFLQRRDLEHGCGW